MKQPGRERISKLEELPNIGSAISQKLQIIGITHPNQLIGKQALALHQALCEKTGEQIDPCVIDIFMSAIDYMEGGEPRPWWTYTQYRKQLMADR
jgi:hypothetical protein